MYEQIVHHMVMISFFLSLISAGSGLNSWQERNTQMINDRIHTISFAQLLKSQLFLVFFVFFGFDSNNNNTQLPSAL